jgi:hypothetical protein
VYRLITEMQIGIHISLMRDIMGSAFAPDQICLAYAKAHDFGLPADQIGCILGFAGRTNQIIFRSAGLDQRANLGNKTTYPVVADLCDNLLKDLKSRIGLAGEIRALLSLGGQPYALSCVHTKQRNSHHHSQALGNILCGCWQRYLSKGGPVRDNARRPSP